MGDVGGAGQSVAHFHFHVFPRKMDDGVAINWERYQKPGDPARRCALAVTGRIKMHHLGSN